MVRRLVSLVIAACSLWLLATPARALVMEAGSVALPATADGQTSFWSQAFSAPFSVQPLVFVLPSNEGGDPCDIRVQNVTTTGFELAQVEPRNLDGRHGAITVHYLAIEPGTYALPGGITLEAASIATDKWVNKWNSGTGRYEQPAFVTNFASAPAVLAQIQTMNNEVGGPPSAPSQPWLTTAVRDITADNFRLALERAETPGGALSTTETIAYLAITSTANSWFVAEGPQPVRLDAFITPDTIKGWDDTGGNGNLIDLAPDFAASPLVIGNLAKRNGADGGWLRRANTTAADVRLIVDEDKYADNERNHIEEAASIVALSQALTLAVSYPMPTLRYAASADGTANNTWENVDGVSGFDWSVQSNTRVPVTDGLTPAITEAYHMPDARGTMQSLEKLSGNPSDEDASFELWFRPTDFSVSGQQVLFETGGNVDGTAIVLDGDTLKFATQDGSNKRLVLSTQLSPSALGRFHQVVGVIDRTSSIEAAFYLDGLLVGSGASAGNDWAGSDGSGLGCLNGTVAGGFSNPVNFQGDIAFFNYYRQALTPQQVLDLYRVVAIPEPATLSLLALGGLALLRRRKQR